MEVICLEEAALYELIDKVTTHTKEENSIKKSKWICGQDSKKQLGITSKTTLQKLRKCRKDPVLPAGEKDHSL
jgi:hypothetical protein